MHKFVLITLLLCCCLLLWCQSIAFADCKVLIDKETNQLAFYENGFIRDVFPVATGRLPQFTPEGNWQVVVKLVYPSWQNPKGGPVIPGGVPDNPLGPRWLGLNALGTCGSTYGIHGTNNPNSIGTYASSGCVRMYNEDILWLYDHVSVGTDVEIVNTSVDLTNWGNYVNYLLNGKEIVFEPHLGAVQYQGTTFFPIRHIADLLGYKLLWDDSNNSIEMSNIEREVLLTIGSNLVTVNNNILTAENAPVLLEDTAYIPDYYLERYLNIDIKRDKSDRTIFMDAPVETMGNYVKRHLVTRVNGKLLTLQEALTPLTDSENLLVPVRPICAAAGALVSWNSTAKTVEIKLMGKHVSIPANGSSASINGSIIETPVTMLERNGYTFINLDFLINIFGIDAKVDDKTRTLNISTEKNIDM
ncbi:MAG: putative L,D-transpeptidase ErfK/SrfK precursor [Pelotomaculum sp. PtaU1.Bin035]|nr:MAG: putative L,D-transpeptidase ErfK/SrfK precursor [Pelotomaculum sp. PtaU1.Bin035]